MPFVNEEHRNKPDLEIPGDRCYNYYKQFVDEWRANPRWTTVDTMYQWVLKSHDAEVKWETAKQLAWQVFFNLHVMPYELKKREENGDI